MIREMVALTALLVAAAPALAQTATTTTNTNTQATTQQSTDAAGTAQGQVAPKPDSDTGATNTGGVTPQANENLPDIGATTGVQPSNGAAPSPDDGAAVAVVDPAIVKEIRDAALAAEKAAAKPPAQKTDEQKAAEAAQIGRHKENFTARVEERLKAAPQG
ncbi:MAG: hypothetical protein K0S81_1498 [Rhodospirillales bacterium]|jgi:hypothetical protein|nr:hypothetical protein [Rhodospirillales bacterium]